MKALLLHRDNPFAWALMPEACERVRAMADRIGGDAPGSVLVEILWSHFVTEKPQWALFVGLEEDGIAAHMLANMEAWAGKTVANVRQLEVDDPGAGRDRGVFDGLRMLVDWARERGAEELRALTLNERLVTHFCRLYGFERYLIMLRRPLDIALRAESQPLKFPVRTENLRKDDERRA